MIRHDQYNIEELMTLHSNIQEHVMRLIPISIKVSNQLAKLNMDFYDLLFQYEEAKGQLATELDSGNSFEGSRDNFKISSTRIMGKIHNILTELTELDKEAITLLDNPHSAETASIVPINKIKRAFVENAGFDSSELPTLKDRIFEDLNNLPSTSIGVPVTTSTKLITNKIAIVSMELEVAYDDYEEKALIMACAMNIPTYFHDSTPNFDEIQSIIKEYFIGMYIIPLNIEEYEANSEETPVVLFWLSESPRDTTTWAVGEYGFYD